MATKEAVPIEGSRAFSTAGQLVIEVSVVVYIINIDENVCNIRGE